MPTNVETLLEALPYIRRFRGATIVIKYGGAAMGDEALREAFATDVALLKFVGINPVIVHGGGPEISDHMERLGLEVEFRDGLRVSSPETVEVAKMVLLGKVNSDILVRLRRQGQPAVGLSGEDGTLFEVSPSPKAEEVGLVGVVDAVNTDLIERLAPNYVPVIASAGADEDGRAHNINADEAAGKVAAALAARRVIFLTDVEGWLSDPDDHSTLISEATASEVRAGLADVGGGMRPKLDACLAAVEGGCEAAQIIDGRVPHGLLLELFTDAGVGTMIRP